MHRSSNTSTNIGKSHYTLFYSYLKTNASSSCYRHDPKELIIVKVCDVVSKKRKSYEVNRDLLRWHSAYFVAILDPQSALIHNSGDNITLEECHKVFNAFVCWIYTGRLEDPPADPTDTSLTPDDVYLFTLCLRMLWIFADKRGIPALGKAAIDMLHERISAEWRLYGQDGILHTYENTTSKSNLPEYIVDAYTEGYSYGNFMKHMTADKVNVEFLLDAIPALANQGVGYTCITREDRTKLDRCQWHDHSEPGGKLRLESRK
jgi:hypothetical protein